MRTRVLTSELKLPFPREQVFHFFSNVENLDLITPAWLNFRIVTPGIAAIKGALLEYRLNLRGIPIRWVTKITEWEPPSYFVDEQLKGPYKKWIHEHRFLQDGAGTLCVDRVEFEVPGWIFEPWLYHLVIRPDLDKIFEYRREWLKHNFHPGLNNDAGK